MTTHHLENHLMMHYYHVIQQYDNKYPSCDKTLVTYVKFDIPDKIGTIGQHSNEFQKAVKIEIVEVLPMDHQGH